MKVQQTPAVDLTYCLNAHPGESWAENFAAIRNEALRVRDAVAPERPFALGLRLSRQAADELSEPVALSAFREFLEAENLYVFTINGFAYGVFHGTAVKDNVYRPDWRTAERLDYTIALADILAALLPEGAAGSISTVPGSYKSWIHCEQDVRDMTDMLADAALHLSMTKRQTGRHICLALEPEADCYLETAGETVAFFAGPLRKLGTRYLRSRHGLSKTECRKVLSGHLGVCLDTAHAAVQFEGPAETLARLRAARIAVPKVQLSAAIHLRTSPETLQRLRDFCDAVYLHQVKARTADGKIISYRDLPDALAAAEQTKPDQQWRVHFHVPLFFDGHEGLHSTADELCGEFAEQLAGGAVGHLEIETYTFNVLPEFMQPADVADGIVREYEWVLRKLFAGCA
ncbi:MAG: metabolite traffic protein EboE [Planctomycetota bacterium]|nr:metabolite traffic protein EboE [Planctomycetota bacterium]